MDSKTYISKLLGSQKHKRSFNNKTGENDSRGGRPPSAHSAGIFVSLHTLSFHLWFTLSTLPVHLVISYSHTFHLSVTWPARCPVTDSQRTGQGLEASFHKTLNSLLDFKSAPQMLYLCKSHTFHFNAIPYP